MSYYALINMLAAGVNESIDRSIPFSERMATGFSTLLLGLGTVFSVLALLWGILELFRVVFARPAKKETAAPAEVIPSVEDAPETEASDDGELAAVIAAAAVSYLDAEYAADGRSLPSGGFRVVSYKKLGAKR